VDMRHPSTPGDRETVRAGDPAGQIPRVQAVGGRSRAVRSRADEGATLLLRPPLRRRSRTCG
jgi:hypothetical protein